MGSGWDWQGSLPPLEGNGSNWSTGAAPLEMQKNKKKKKAERGRWEKKKKSGWLHSSGNNEVLGSVWIELYLFLFVVEDFIFINFIVKTLFLV